MLPRPPPFEHLTTWTGPTRPTTPEQQRAYRASSAGLAAYAVWAGLGVALVATIGVLFLGESMNWIKGRSLELIIIGVVGLNLVSAEA